MDYPAPFDDVRTRVLALLGLGAVSLVFGLETGSPVAVAVGGVMAGVAVGVTLRRWRQ